MAVTGTCLVLFVTFHVLMNAVAIAWPSAYNEICKFLGANWYALIASAGLAALFIIHILYALWLTVQNRKARGGDRYKINTRPASVEWASQNMLVLGLVVVAFLVVHMIQFWAKMQLMEVCGSEYHVGATPIPASAGTLFIQLAFEQIWTPIVYIIGFVALWFHMTHGFWSMFQTVGWDNTRWLPRLKKIGCWWTTIVVGLFVIQAVVFTINANNGKYLTDATLRTQYAESLQEQMVKEMQPLQEEFMSLKQTPENFVRMQEIQNEAQQIQQRYQESIESLMALGDRFKAPAAPVAEEAADEVPVPEDEAAPVPAAETDTVND